MFATARRRLDLSFLRYVLAGGLVSAIYAATTSALILLADVPLEVAVAVGYFTGVIVHFQLHRGFVFAGRGTYALSRRQQTWRYLLVVVVQYLVTTAGVVALSRAGLPDLAAFLLTTSIVTPLTFLLMRARLFHAAAEP